VRPPSPTANRHRVIAAILLALALGGGLGLVFHAIIGQTKADDDDAESVANPPTRVTMKNGVTVLTLSEADLQNAGIEIARLTPAPALDSILGFATVLDPGPLNELSSQYLDAQRQIQTADAKLAASQAAFERANVLYKDQQNVSTAQLQSAQSSFDVDRTALAAAQSRLNAVSGTAREAWGNVLGKSLIDHTPQFSDLIARRDYLLKVTLPPGVILTSPPETASATLNGDTKLQLTYVSLATAANPKLQGIAYFYTAPAQDGLLPGLNLEVSLAAKSAARGWVVPNSAVVWLEGQAWIYIRTDPKTFIRRQIAPNRPAENDGYIVTGLPAGAEVAVHGAQMLLSEEFRAQVPVED
jgi:hypothetical protein